MRPLIVCSDITVDGFMSGPDNDLDFRTLDDELDAELNDKLRRAVDTVVVGHTTFGPMAAHWTQAKGDLADWMNGVSKVMLTHDPDADVGAWPNTTLAPGDGVDVVRQLKRRQGKALVVFGGVSTVRSLVTAGLADEYWLKVNPAAIGRGGSMFADLTNPQKLSLVSVKSFPSGKTIAEYRAA